MSPRAALRLEHLGFTDVYDYVPGKSDWTAAGLAREGESARIPNAGDVVQEVPTCYFGDPLETTRKAMNGDRAAFCVVVDDGNVVFGMVYMDDEQLQRAENVEDAMHAGPTTIRANEPLKPLIERMERAGVDGILVTDPEGRLLGLVDRQHATTILRGGERKPT